MAKDTQFMQDMGFIDYSLLLSIRKIDNRSDSDIMNNPEVSDLLHNMDTSIQNKDSQTKESFEKIQNTYHTTINKNSGKSKEDFSFSEVGDGDKPLLTGNLFFSADKKWCYQIGVIDYLQVYNFQKKAEVLFKRYIKNKDPKKVSVCHSKPYGNRYIHFMRH